MRINTNGSALNSWRHFSAVSRSVERTMEWLSSGQRINRAGDGPAALAISENMRGQIRGLRQSLRNIADGISVVRTAEAALGNTAMQLQRGRELAIQAANGVWTDEQRTTIQLEVDSLIAEIDRIAEGTEFNGIQLLGGGNGQVTDMVNSLRRSWLANAEQLVFDQYGLQADDVSLKIVADTAGPNPAYVYGTYDGSGKMTNLELHLNLSLLQDMSLPNGGEYPQYADRVVGHEMVHAIMARTMDFQALPAWFKEGAAEFLVGADERLAGDLAAAGSTAALVGEVATWEGDSTDYSAGYAAVKYLHGQATGGMQAVMARLAAGDTLDQAINTTTGGTFTDTASFLADFTGAGGQAFVNGLDLTDADVGAIGGGTAESVVPDSDVNTSNPLQHFAEIWPDKLDPEQRPISLHVGPNNLGSQQLDLPTLQGGSYALGLVGVDLVGD
ncbi:MAG TPA: flagellinolysin, partial [Symbiobacteriaceae bacterium]|nr:flagellinolysin [Symbiobacteriaceae bacterium]